MVAGFKLPLDAYVLMVPIAYATTMCATLTLRAAFSDPEASSLSFYDKEKESAQIAQRHDSTFKQFFDARIQSHRLGVFRNWFPGSPQ